MGGFTHITVKIPVLKQHAEKPSMRVVQIINVFAAA